jgi:arabinoxylan arabinofuranohydrolase
MGEDGTIGDIVQTKNARRQRGSLDPFKAINAATFAAVGGADTAPADETSRACGCGTMLLSGIHDGAFVKLQGLDFGEKGAAKITAKVRISGKGGVIRVSTGAADGEVIGYLPVEGEGDCLAEAALDVPVSGKKDVYFVFSGEGYEVLEWCFA